MALSVRLLAGEGGAEHPPGPAELPSAVRLPPASPSVAAANPDKRMTIDWNFVLQVLNVQAGSTLAFDGIVSKSKAGAAAGRAGLMSHCLGCQVEPMKLQGSWAAGAVLQACWALSRALAAALPIPWHCG